MKGCPPFGGLDCMLTILAQPPQSEAHETVRRNITLTTTFLRPSESVSPINVVAPTAAPASDRNSSTSNRSTALEQALPQHLRSGQYRSGGARRHSRRSRQTLCVVWLQAAPAAAKVLGIEAVPSQPTLSRFCAVFTQRTSQALTTLHTRAVVALPSWRDASAI